MKTLSKNDIQKLRAQFNLMPSGDLERLGKQFFKKQPQGYAYIQAKMDESLLNQDEKELLLYLSILTYSMIMHAVPRVPKPKEVPLANFEESQILNQMLFTGLEQATDEEIHAKYISMLTDHVQPEIFRFLMEAIWQDESGAHIQPANRHRLMQYLLSLLDGLVEM